MKKPNSIVRALQGAGWRIYLDGGSTAPDGVPWFDFYPVDVDAWILIPVSEAAGDALGCAIRRRPIPERGKGDGAMKKPASVVGALQAAGWRIYLDGRSMPPDGVPWDFYPWDDDDLIPASEAASDALRHALFGKPIPERGDDR